MAIVIPTISNRLFLELIFGKKTSSVTQKLKLFKNDFVPTKNSILDDLEEADFGGYHEIILSNSDWTVDTLSGVTSASCPEQVFVIEELAVIYGYYVTVEIDSVEYLYWLERFSDGPYELPPAGGSVAITANLGVF
jgi:hypothetical protein